MTECPDCGVSLVSLSDHAEHMFVDHGVGEWGGPDCPKCGGAGEYLASRVPNRFGDEDWRICPACKGLGTV